MSGIVVPGYQDIEMVIDLGIATGGSTTTIVDTGKVWTVNMWGDATYEVTIGGVEYLGIVTSNTADTITIPAIAVAVTAGCKYELKRPVYLIYMRAETGAGAAPLGVNVAAASAVILAANATRKVAALINDSDSPMWLAIGQAAVINRGIRLNARGGTLLISRSGDIYSQEAIYGIHAAAGNKVITIQELN